MNNELPDWILARIPEYKEVEYIPQSFNDSTHQLWRLQGSNSGSKNHFLKIPSNTKSPFWQIMQDLFGFDLNKEIDSFSKTYTLIDKTCSLHIPELINAEIISGNHAYILTSELKGKPLESGFTNKMVKQLANHLAELHANSKDHWGALNHPTFKAADWSDRLEISLKKSTKRWGDVFFDSDIHLDQALASCRMIDTTRFVPAMPDLRSDQFLQIDGNITALIDLDAFVFAPIELDFVILEYLLAANQITIFSQAYATHHDIPEIESVRVAYRLLLFYMQILGKKDLNKWMNKETFF